MATLHLGCRAAAIGSQPLPPSFVSGSRLAARVAAARTLKIIDLRRSTKKVTPSWSTEHVNFNMV